MRWSIVGQVGGGGGGHEVEEGLPGPAFVVGLLDFEDAVAVEEDLAVGADGFPVGGEVEVFEGADHGAGGFEHDGFGLVGGGAGEEQGGGVAAAGVADFAGGGVVDAVPGGEVLVALLGHLEVLVEGGDDLAGVA